MKNVVIILISGFLIFAAVPPTRAALGWQVPADIGVGPTAYDVDDVRQVQMMLKNRGFDPGDINGMVSSQTQEALRRFQMANNLPVTGKIDQRTQRALGITVKGTGPNAGDTNQVDSNTNYVRSKPMPPAQAEQRSAEIDKDAQERVNKAAMVLQELTRAEDKRIPKELLERAEVVAVIPNMIKGAFGIGGRYGKGVVSKRLSNGRWSSPAFIQIGGGSFGLQLGGSSTDLVLVFTDGKALGLLEKGKDLKLGVDAGVVAGPIGRTAEAGVNANLESAIYSYSRSKGLFAGVALDGAVLDLDDSMNKKVYGSDVTANNVLNGRVKTTFGRTFVDTLERVAPKRIS